MNRIGSFSVTQIASVETIYSSRGELEPVIERLGAKRAFSSPMIQSKPALDSLQSYFGSIRSLRLLDEMEERNLAEAFQDSGNVAAGQRLVTANLRLVVKIAHEYSRGHHNLPDLVQEGNFGLLLAVRKFDPNRGVRLITYASWWIRAYILRYIMNNARMVKLGTTQPQRKVFYNLGRERARLAAMGVDPTTERIAEHLGVKERVVEEMDWRMRANDISLDAPATLNEDEDGRTRLDRLPSSQRGADERIDSIEQHEILVANLKEFSETLMGRERYIFTQRLTADRPLTLRQIGEELGVSRERVRQIERRILNRLRGHLVANMGEHIEAHLDA